MFIIDDIVNAIGGWVASGQQQQAAKEAMAQQQQIYNQQRADQAPWLNAGQTSLTNLMNLTGHPPSLDPSQVASDPGYQFRMQQGQQALERSAAARGGLASGGFMKGLDRYSQGLASDEYNNAWNRQQTGYGNQWGRLYQLSGMGLNAAQNLGGIGSSFANNMSNLYGAKGNAQAAGTLAMTSNAAQGVRDVGNIATMGMGGGFSGIGGIGGGGGLAGLMGGGGGSQYQGYSQAPQLIPTQGG